MLIYLCNVCGWFSLHQGWIVSADYIWCFHHVTLLLSSLQLQRHRYNCTVSSAFKLYYATTYYHFLPVYDHHVKTRKEKTLNFECHIFKAKWSMHYFIIKLDVWDSWRIRVFHTKEVGIIKPPCPNFFLEETGPNNIVFITQWYYVLKVNIIKLIKQSIHYNIVNRKVMVR